MTITVLGISGSLRSASTNAAALRTAAHLAPDGAEVVLYARVAELPHFTPDLDCSPLPPAVADLRAALHGADALLLCVPEYAGALPGPLLNALDWLIGDDQPGNLDGKPAAYLNVSPRGASGAHASLRSVLSYAGARLVEAACVEVPLTSAAVVDGVVVDAPAVEAIERGVAALVGWVRGATT